MDIHLRHREGEAEVTQEELAAVEIETELEWTKDILQHPDPEIAEQARQALEFIEHVMDYRSEQGIALPRRILAFQQSHPGEIQQVEEEVEVFHALVVDFRSLYGDVFHQVAGAEGTVEDFEAAMMEYVDGVARDVHRTKHLVAEKSGKQLGVIEAEHLLTTEFVSKVFAPPSVYPDPIRPRQMTAFVHATKGPLVDSNGNLSKEREVKDVLQVGFGKPSEAVEEQNRGGIPSAQLAS